MIRKIKIQWMPLLFVCVSVLSCATPAQHGVEAIKGARRALSQHQKAQIQQDISIYQTRHMGKLPEALDATVTRTLKDPWGNPWSYELSLDKKNYTLISTGRDGEEGTEDDVVVHEP